MVVLPEVPLTDKLGKIRWQTQESRMAGLTRQIKDQQKSVCASFVLAK